MNSIVFSAVSSDWKSVLTHTDTLTIAMIIVGILVGGIVTITKLLIRHRERMALIERGIHPDHPPEATPSAEPPREQYLRG